ncbi:MAG TPA: PAS domain S-box protein [Smithella sp.]|nr:PAS domain S-box protein [Smithella sp.]
MKNPGKIISGNKKRIKTVKKKTSLSAKSLLPAKNQSEKKKFNKISMGISELNSSAARGARTPVPEEIERAEKYQNIFRNLHDGCFELDLAGNFTFFNNSVSRILGYSPEELMGMNFRQYTDQENADKVFEVYNKVYSEGELAKRFNWQVTRKDGAKRYIETSVSLQKSSTGEPTGFIGIVSDITERRQAEKTLRETTLMLESSINSSPLAIVVIDNDDKVSVWNPAAENIFGWKEHEVIGRTIPIIPDHKKEEFQKTGEEVKRQKKVIRTERTHRQRKDGSLLDVSISVSSINDANGNTIGRMAIYADITEHVRAEQKTRESEKLYKAIFENTGNTTIIISEDKTISLINAEFEKLTGYKREEVENKKKWTEFIVKEDLEKMLRQDRLRRNNQGAALRSYEIRLIDKAGEKKDVLLFVDMINSTKQAVASLMDITERKKAEENLRHSEEKYRSILENIREAYFEVDLHGNFTFFNDSLCRIIGWPREELIDAHYSKFTDEENKKNIFQAFNKVYKTGGLVEGFDWLFIRKDGFKGYVGASVLLKQDSAGTPVGFKGILRDVTDRKRAENALKESEERYRELSIIDDLTQLYNSRHFYDQLRMEIGRLERHEYPLTLLLLDLDDFKIFNDTYGHIEGDRVLFRLGEVIRRCLRKEGTAYRYGGEEFTIILPMTTKEEGAVIAERVREEFKKENFSPARDENVNLTVSIGLAQYQRQEDMKAFVSRADQLMYRGKKDGKDRVCFD